MVCRSQMFVAVNAGDRLAEISRPGIQEPCRADTYIRPFWANLYYFVVNGTDVIVVMKG